MIRLALAALLTAAPAALPAAAQDDFELMDLAFGVGSVLGSEEACGLTFDQDAISRFIDERVPPESLDFHPSLQTAMTGAEFQAESMTPSQTTAHCRAVENSARHYGWIK